MASRDLPDIVEKASNRTSQAVYGSPIRLKHLPILVTILTLLLFLSLLGGLFFGSTLIGGEITLDRTISLWLSLSSFEIFVNSVVIAVGAGFIATLSGTVYAWLLVRTNIPWKDILRIIAILPLAMAPLVQTVGWVAILSPKIGVVNVIFKDLSGSILFDLYSIEGIIIALGFSSFPVSFLIMEPEIRSLSPSLEQASRSSGAGIFKTFRKIALPLMIPGMASVFLLTTLYAFGNFEYPFVFGSAQGGIDTYATVIYNAVFVGLRPDYAEATMFAMLYTILAIVMVIGYQYLTKGQFRFEMVSGRSERVTRHQLGVWKYGGVGICLGIATMAFFVPFIGLLGLSLAPDLSRVFGGITLKHYIEFFEYGGIANAIKNTVILGIGSAFGVVIVSLLISYTTLKMDIRFAKAGDYIATLPLGLPPIVYGLAIFWLVLLGPLSGSYGALWPMIVAVTLLKVPQGTRIISSSLIHLGDEMEEASLSTGASWFRTFRKIILPLLKGGILNAFIFAFTSAIKQLAAIVLLIVGGNNVLMSVLLFLYNNDPFALPAIGAGSVMITVVLLVMVLYQNRVLKHPSFS